MSDFVVADSDGVVIQGGTVAETKPLDDVVVISDDEDDEGLSSDSNVGVASDEPRTCDQNESGRVLTCELCRMTFSETTLLWLHYLNPCQPGDSDAGIECVCTACGEKFRSKVLLNLHIDCVHFKRKAWPPKTDLIHKCDFCEKRFNRKYNRAVHMRLVHNFVPQPLSDNLQATNAFKCVKCGTDFKTKHSLERHVLRSRLCSDSAVVDLTRFECPHCQKTYKNHYDLSRHVKCHAPDRPFECKQCGINFSVKYNLTVHNKRKHPDK